MFGKHFFKVGRPRQHEQEERGLAAGTAPTRTRSSGARPGLDGMRRHHRQQPRPTSCSRDMTFGFSEFSGQRPVPQRWKDLEFYVAGLLEGAPAHDPRLRRALLELLQLRMPTTTARPRSTRRRSTRRWATIPATACCSLPAPRSAGDAGFAGRHRRDRTARCIRRTSTCSPRASGFAWDVNGRRQDRGPRRLRPVLPARAASARPQHRRQPAVQPAAHAASATSTATSSPAPAASASANGRAHRAAASSARRRPNNWQWNVSVEREIAAATRRRARLRRQQGQEPAADPRHQPGAEGDINGNGVDDRGRVRRCSAMAPSGSAAVPGRSAAAITFWDHSGSSIYHSLQTQLRQPLRPRLAVPGVLHLVAHDRERAPGQQRRQPRRRP